MKFIVSRKKWFRGHGSWLNNSALRNEDGQQCCLGFVARQCGLKTGQILMQNTPDDVAEPSRAKFPKWLLKKRQGELVNTAACKKAMEINDCEELTERKREAKLRALFRKHGDQIVFKP